MEIIDLHGKKLHDWDELVDASPHGTFFHRSDWLTMSSDQLGKKLKVYGCLEDGHLVGGISLFFYKEGFLKVARSIVEMTPYGGMVLSESPSSRTREKEHRAQKIVNELLCEIATEHCHVISLTNSPGFADVRPFTWNGWSSNVKYTYHVNLQNDIKQTISKTARWSIKKAFDGGVTVKKKNDASTFYRLFSTTFARQGLKPPVDEMYFKKVIGILESKLRGQMWIAETSTGEIMSAEIVTQDRWRAYRWAAASDIKFKVMAPTSLLLFDIMQDLKTKYVNEINVLAANTPRLASFVSQFNPALVPYYTVEQISRPLEVLRGVSRFWSRLRSS